MKQINIKSAVRSMRRIDAIMTEPVGAKGDASDVRNASW